MQQMDTDAAVTAARDIMAERARDRMLKKSTTSSSHGC